jgi:hypothetical protein
MLTELKVDHEGEFVIFIGSSGKLARIHGEEAIVLARSILDAAEKSLRGVDNEDE